MTTPAQRSQSTPCGNRASPFSTASHEPPVSSGHGRQVPHSSRHWRTSAQPNAREALSQSTALAGFGSRGTISFDSEGHQLGRNGNSGRSGGVGVAGFWLRLAEQPPLAHFALTPADRSAAHPILRARCRRAPGELAGPAARRPERRSRPPPTRGTQDPVRCRRPAQRAARDDAGRSPFRPPYPPRLRVPSSNVLCQQPANSSGAILRAQE